MRGFIVLHNNNNLVAEATKHNANDPKCAELGWVRIPLAVESYGCWGMEGQQSFSCLAAHLAIQMGCNKSQTITILYQRLSLSLVRANARALLSRARSRHSEEGVEVCGCGVVAAVTLILLVCCTVYINNNNKTSLRGRK